MISKQLIAYYSSVLPLKQDLLSINRLPGSYPVQPFQEIVKAFKDKGFEFKPVESLDVNSPPSALIFFDLPSSIDIVRLFRSRYPATKFFLYTLESPAHSISQFYPQALKIFDCVITYNKNICDESRVFYCPIPFDCPSKFCDLASHPWESRKTLVGIASRKKSGFMCPNGNGWLNKLGIRGIGETWPFSLRSFLSQWVGFQYLFREKLFSYIDKHLPSELSFDLYGSGWRGEPIGYFERFLCKPKILRSSRGIFKGDKLRLLSYYRYSLVVENWIGDEGYISEKLNESLSVGCIPIYWGDQKVIDAYPPSLVINGNNFSTYHELFSYLLRENRESWHARLSSFDKLYRTPLFASCLPSSFSKRFISIVLDSLL